MTMNWRGAWTRTGLISTMGAVALGLPAFVQAETKTGSFMLTIPAAPLGDALNDLAQQTGLQVLFLSQLVEQMRGPNLTGSHTAEEALTTLLANTGLKFEFVDARTVIIVSASNPPGQPTKPIEAPAGKKVSEQKIPEQKLDSKNASSESVKATSTNNSNVNSGDNLVKHSSFVSRLAAFLGVCASASLSSTACAQDAAKAESLEEIVVTGSRVITNGNDSPTPVTVVSVEQLLEMNPGPVTQALAMLPALLATPNQGGQGPNPQAVINLRGIGGARNLIMFDGHRVAPTSGGAGVDTNLIPTMLLKRVDIVTGGASAVYGSDAVSGVVNYVMDNKFNGVKFNAQAGESNYSDDHTWNGGIAFGAPVFSGRGHVEASYQVFNDPGVMDRFARAWGRQLWSTDGSVAGSAATAGSQANPYQIYSNTRLNATSFGGLINSGPLAGLNFTQNGVLSTFNHGSPTGSSAVEVGGDGGYYTVNAAFTGQNMQQAFGRLDFDFTDTVRGYAEVAFGQSLNWWNGAGGGVWNSEVRSKAIGWNNAYLRTVQQPYQATIATQLAANPLGSFNFSRILTADQMPSPRTELLSKQTLILAGLEGSVGDYKWNVGVEHSDMNSTNKDINNLNNARLYAAMNAVVNSSGQVVCNAALANPSVYGSCVPLNLFGPSVTNGAAFNYIRQETHNTTKYTMDNVTFAVTGAPVNGWAGPIDMALSGEWRKLTYQVDSNALPTDPVNCTGIQFNCTSSTTPYFAGVTANFPKASVKVTEFAYEAQLPLLKDAFLAKSWGLNAAARYTNYQTSGTVYTWKLGTTWTPTDELTVRVTRSRDIRAPTLNDLYAPLSVGTVSILDLHTGVTANTNSVTQGNPALTPEKADNWTAGFVWTPQFIDGLSLSMDYYRINISNGIVGIGTRQPATMAACEASGGTSPICAFYVRPFPFSNTSAANFPTSIINASLNSAGYLTYGVDTEIGYRHPIAGHDFSARLLANYQPHLIYDLGPAGVLDVGGAADGVGGLPATPNVKATLQLSYEVVDNLKMTVQERYRNALKQNGSQLLYFAFGKQPPTFYTDLTFNYKMQVGAGDLETFFNVRNLFNTQPDPWASSGGNSQIGAFGGWLQGDDPMGRYYTVGLRYKL